MYKIQINDKVKDQKHFADILKEISIDIQNGKTKGVFGLNWQITSDESEDGQISQDLAGTEDEIVKDEEKVDEEETDDTDEDKDECDICGGTGEVTVDELDPDSGRYAPTGTRKCECEIDDEEVDDQE